MEKNIYRIFTFAVIGNEDIIGKVYVLNNSDDYQQEYETIACDLRGAEHDLAIIELLEKYGTLIGNIDCMQMIESDVYNKYYGTEM